jgi:hypothetical protein
LPTFRKKNAVVDARQFTGERQNGLDLILWINSHGGAAMWSEHYSSNGRLSMNVWGRSTFVHKNYWVILNQDGTFDRMSPEDFDEEYEQV